MIACTTSSAPKIALVLALLFAPASSSQSQASPGRLQITSMPPGEKIIINGETRTEVTNVTLVVAPGQYTVQVGNCPAKTVSVSSGGSAQVSCP